MWQSPPLGLHAPRRRIPAGIANRTPILLVKPAVWCTDVNYASDTGLAKPATAALVGVRDMSVR